MTDDGTNTYAVKRGQKVAGGIWACNSLIISGCLWLKRGQKVGVVQVLRILKGDKMSLIGIEIADTRGSSWAMRHRIQGYSK